MKKRIFIDRSSQKAAFLRYVLGLLIFALLVVLLASELVNEKPKPKKQKLFSVRASVQINKHGPDNIFLKENLCFAQDRDFTNQDLNHFCKGVNDATSSWSN